MDPQKTWGASGSQKSINKSSPVVSTKIKSIFSDNVFNGVASGFIQTPLWNMAMAWLNHPWKKC